MIVAMMRIKNEARWIASVIVAQLPIVDRLYILDDHSTDATTDICRGFPKVELFHSPFQGTDETRDKNWLLGKVESASPDWVLHIDGDEELAPGSSELIRQIVANPGECDSFRFKVLYLWDRPDQIRVDGIYGNFYRGSLFKFHPGRRFQSAVGGGFHCGNVPDPRNITNCAASLIHYGYMHAEDRRRKYEWYNSADKQPIPTGEDGYRHMVIGDVFPADMKTRWGGPLKLVPYNRAA